MAGSHERVNLMLEEGATVVTDKDGLLAALGVPKTLLPKKETAPAA